MGFANAELLQAAKIDDKAKMDPRNAGPMPRKWRFNHDPESYAEEAYEKVLLSMKNGVKWYEDESNHRTIRLGIGLRSGVLSRLLRIRRMGGNRRLELETGPKSVVYGEVSVWQL
jgi:hypothetical protein